MATQQFKTQTGVSLLSNNNYLVDQWAGPTVHFVKTNYGEEVDIISDEVHITRGNNSGIYNPVTEIEWDQNVSPGNTLWNADGWDDLSDTTSRTYVTFYDVNGQGGLGHQVVGTEYIMKDTVNDKYYTVKFQTWQTGGYGGAFSYIRREINTDVFFIHTNNGDEVDYIYIDEGNPSNNVAITRGTNAGIYNPDVEGSYVEEISPGNTLWNSDGWDDLSNVTTRQYLNWHSAVKGAAGEVITGIQFVMKAIIHHDGADDTYEYYTIEFGNWTSSNNGGGFSYIRKKINPANPAIGLKFADNTVQTTAVTEQRLGVIPRSEIHDASYDYYITERDIGQHVVFYQTCDINIPDANTVDMPIGAVITIINMSGGTCGVYKDNNNENGTIYNGTGVGSTTGWGLTTQGIYTVIKLRTYYDGYPVTDWMISGPALDENWC